MGRWRFVLIALAAVLAVAGAVAANQILSDGVWRWWPWAPIAVGVALIGAVVTDRFTRSASARHHVAPGNVGEGLGTGVAIGPPTAVEVGEGEAGMREEFRAAYDAAGGVEVLGEAQDRVTALGPGFVQTFTGRSQSGRVIVCGLPGRPAAVVPMPVWEALRGVGDVPGHDDGVVAAGFPVSPSATEPLVLVDSPATTVELDGGRWVPGRLRRVDPEGLWWWEPLPLVDSEVSAHANRWGDFRPFDLQLRAVAEFPWQRSAIESEVSPERRRLLQRAMAATEFAKVFAVLSMHRGALAAEPVWSTATGIDTHGSDRCVHLRAVLAAPDGRPALTGDVLLHVPDFVGLSSVLGCAQVRIDFDAWRLALDAAGADLGDSPDLRLSLLEVIEMLASAWGTVTGTVPRAVVDDPRRVPIVKPPFVAMYLQTNPPATRQPNLGLAGAMDLGPLGPATRDEVHSSTGMRVAAALDLARSARRDLIATGLARLGRSWGYVDANPDDLLAVPGRSRPPVAGQ